MLFFHIEVQELELEFNKISIISQHSPSTGHIPFNMEQIPCHMHKLQSNLDHCGHPLKYIISIKSTSISLYNKTLL